MVAKTRVRGGKLFKKLEVQKRHSSHFSGCEPNKIEYRGLAMGYRGGGKCQGSPTIQGSPTPELGDLRMELSMELSNQSHTHCGQTDGR